VINPAYLRSFELGLDAARPDLFQRGLFAIAASPKTPGDALKLAADVANMLGAGPLFADAMEIDGLLAATHTLPQLMAAALLNATVGQPGWQEGRKFAGRFYADVTAPGASFGSAKALSKASLLNQENVLRTLDGAIDALQSFREDIRQNNADSLEARLEQARQAQAQWVQERLSANWAAEGMPESVAKSARDYDVLTRLFGTAWKKKRK
jgi:prephenate dehydrogenase